jgi:hypothetical protein
MIKLVMALSEFKNIRPLQLNDTQSVFECFNLEKAVTTAYAVTHL